ncbi:hypothetical protein CV102_12840 [Natronococcus pandeyae]|uniref:Uncharacterized protein n=1 Tax=Natronococcus pandeyae TaxID=2055836 RepID=A0A8J8Q408_9EURY|nr:hypothetical protein [Natronococcus pandeyae]TYL38088.1 hypothetical protein CV102_12840 [Natronococcus pandeyae]
MTLGRRELLGLAGATATVAAVGTAGCLPVSAQEEGDELPTYSRWLTIDDGGLEFVHVDWAALEGFVGDELEEAGPDEEVPEEFRADPMIAPVSDGLLRAYFFVGLDLAQYRLGRLLDVDDEFESTVEGLLLTDDAFVVTGEMVTEEIDARLTAEPEAEFIRQLERTDDIGGYDVYTPVEGDTDAAVAVDSDALVVVDGEDGEPTATLETTIGASTGDVERATDESGAFEWVVSSAGEGDVAVGQYGPVAGTQPNGEGLVDFGFDELEDAEAIVSSLAVEDEETSTGEFAAVVDEPDEAALEELLGASGDEQSVDVDGDRVTATATWREENLTTD